MGDQSPHRTMNLDLNLVHAVNSIRDFQPESMSFGDWLLGSMRETVSIREHFAPVWRHIPVPMGNGNSGQEMIKTKNDGLESSVKSGGDESSFFDCNICLDLANEPVVTCCGHLFCWSCIYRWLFVHSSAKECPICKGEVTMKTITPIYSRGNNGNVAKGVDLSSSVKIPIRPQANRVESWRQSFQRNEINIPMFEMIRRLDNRFDLTRDTVSDNPQETPSSVLINRIFTSRGIRTARDSVSGAEDLVLTSPSANPNPAGLNGGDTLPNLTSAESFVESYFRDHPDERNQDELSLIDTHSMSSVAGIIQSESQSTETDSLRRRRRICETSTSRVSDGNSGESRPRRRRLQ